jgi:hypothetical protein
MQNKLIMASSNYTLVDIYRWYRAQGGTLPKALFKNICQDFNIHIMNHIIYDHGTFDMGSNLSTINILRIKRNHNKPQVNWNESNKLKQQLLDEGKELYDPETGEGEEWLVYHTDPWYCRFYWKKFYAKVKNKSAYSFRATRGKKGNKTKLKDFLRANSLNYRGYEKADKS